MSLAELRCLLLHWGCVRQGWEPGQALAELCAYMDLVLLELVSLGVSALQGVAAQGGFCNVWQSRSSGLSLGELAQSVLKDVLDVLGDRGIKRWQDIGMSHLNAAALAKRKDP